MDEATAGGNLAVCGICGFVGVPGADAAMLRAMTDAMAHRGPDDDGHWLDGDTGLGARRLAIIDAPGSRQPLQSEDGRVQVVVNGEIYNYKALREELGARGHRFLSEGDGEVIAHLYEDMGIDLVRRLRGMFAFALFDRATDTLYLARDRFGIKPLFVARGRDGGMVFGSDVRSILASGSVRSVIDGHSLWQYFTYQYVPGRDTLWAGIHRLPAAHVAEIRGGVMRERAYWQPRFAPEEGLDIAEAAASVREALETSVRMHLESDVPVGAFLSSGIDSSAVAAIARRYGELDTFSVAFEGAQAAANELAGARVVASALGTRHHEVEVSAARYRDAWPSVVENMEDPVADPAAPGIYFLSEAASRHVRVILSGEGADELFGGYPVYRQPLDLRRLSAMPAWVQRRAQAWARSMPPGRPGRGFVERATTPLDRLYLGGAKLLDARDKMALLGPYALSAMPAEDPFDIAAPWYEGTQHLDGPTRMQAADLGGWLQGDILVKADKMSMAHSIEVRVPFLDPGVWDVARRLPTRLKLTHGTTKYALRQAVADLLPSDAHMRPKLGFPVPLRAWLRGPLEEYVRAIADGPWPDGYVDRAAFRRILDENRDGRTDAWRTIYAVVTFVLWYRRFVHSMGD